MSLKYVFTYSNIVRIASVYDGIQCCNINLKPILYSTRVLDSDTNGYVRCGFSVVNIYYNSVYAILTGSNRSPESPTEVVLLVIEHRATHVTLEIQTHTPLLHC